MTTIAPDPDDLGFMRLALRLARRGYGQTSPNPMVGAVVVKGRQLAGQGWHHRAGAPHAEIEALQDARRRGVDPAGATLYVTLEPCSTHGRTPPCTEAIIAARIRRVVCACTDPNPTHAGRGFELLRAAGVTVRTEVLAGPAQELNEAFNHWIVQRTPWVILKAALSLDGKIATVTGASKWITGEQARAWGMNLRQGADAIVVGVNTIIADDPQLTLRRQKAEGRSQKAAPEPPEDSALRPPHSALESLRPPPSAFGKRRIILDSRARTPLDAQVVRDQFADRTIVVVTPAAPSKRVAALEKKVTVWRAPAVGGRVDLRWLMKRLGQAEVTSLLVEGGGEVHASFLQAGLAHRVAFFYAPIIIGGREAPSAVGGAGIRDLARTIALSTVHWRRLGHDYLLTGRIG